MGFILMYDITNEESFNAVQDWCAHLQPLWECFLSWVWCKAQGVG